MPGIPRIPGSAAGALAARAQRIRVSRGGSISLATGVAVLVPFNVEQYKNGVTHSTVTDPEDITIEQDGYYNIVSNVNLVITDMTSQGARSVLARLLVDGVDIAQRSFTLTGFTSAATNTLNFDLSPSDIRALAVDNVLNLEVTATFGSGTVAIVAGATGTYLALHRES